MRFTTNPTQNKFRIDILCYLLIIYKKFHSSMNATLMQDCSQAKNKSQIECDTDFVSSCLFYLSHTKIT